MDLFEVSKYLYCSWGVEADCLALCLEPSSLASLYLTLCLVADMWAQ